MPDEVTARDAIGRQGLMTLDEVADFLRLCRGTVEQMVRRGDLPVVRVGRRSVRVPVRAVLEYANSRLTDE